MNARQINAKSFIATAAIAFAAAAPTFAFAWGNGDQTEHPVFSNSVSRSAPLNTLAWGPGDQTEIPQFNQVFKAEGEAFSGLVTASDRMPGKTMTKVLNQKTRMQVLDELKMASDADRAQQNVN